MLRRNILLSAALARSPLQFENLYGFELKTTKSIEALNLVTYVFQHNKTGAAYYHVDINDTNNTFCIGFRTPAENSKGTSHVLEHTTLCGSKKYPVRDPFFMMMRRSLSTFMNAMTGPDYTLYPFSTTNHQDFKNLLNVYLDAVFFPLLREEDFHQEGHRVEVEKDESGKRRLQNNGVVFNEMRGVVSDPNHHFMKSLMSTMLPDTHYTYESGGYPTDILKLTYEELKSFQQRHYTPSNSITFTYGDQHPAEHMKTLDEFFNHFPQTEKVVVPTLPETSRFSEPKLVRGEGPLDPMGHPERQKRISVSYAVPQAENNIEDVVELNVLCTLLGRGPSSPMYKALIESQIGSKYAPMKGYAFSLSTPIISYGVAGVDEKRPNAEEEVRVAVKDALENVKKEGFDERRVRSVVFQEELQQRHRAADYGLNLCTGLCAMGLCRSCNDPLDFINWLPHLERINKDAGKGLLNRIDKDLLHNPHSAVVSMSAKKDSLNVLRDELKAADDKLNVNVTEETLDKVEKETEAWLARVRAPQNSDLLPTLRTSDIPLKAFAEPLPNMHSSSVATIPFPTNGLVYVHGIIPFDAKFAELISTGPIVELSPNFPLVQAMIGQTGAGKYSYKDLFVASELVSGGFSYSAGINESYKQRNHCIAGTQYGFYTTKEKLQEALEMLQLILSEPRVDAADAEIRSQVLSLTKMACSGLIQSLQSQGHRFAVTNAVSTLSRKGQIQERLRGLTCSKHASSVLETLQGAEGSNALVDQLLSDYQAATSALRQNVAGGLMWATCEEQDQQEVASLLEKFMGYFPRDAVGADGERRRLILSESVLPVTTTTPAAGAERAVRREKLPIDTSFVGMALPNTLSWQDKDQSALRIACTLLSNEYLHRRVREEGGAYGSGASATLQGDVGGLTMFSYRDPTPDMSVTAFEEAKAWIADPANITQSRIDEAKLRFFSTIDSPYAADSFGESYFFHDVTQDLKQSMRNELLAVSQEDILRVAKYFDMSGVTTSITVLQPEDNSAAASASDAE